MHPSIWKPYAAPATSTSPLLLAVVVDTTMPPIAIASLDIFAPETEAASPDNFVSEREESIQLGHKMTRFQEKVTTYLRTIYVCIYSLPKKDKPAHNIITT